MGAGYIHCNNKWIFLWICHGNYLPWAIKNSLRAVSDYPDTLEEWYLSRIIMGDVTSPLQEMELLENVTREQVIEAAKLVQLDAVYLLTSKEEKDAD